MRKIDRFDKYMEAKGLNDNKVTVQLGLSSPPSEFLWNICGTLPRKSTHFLRKVQNKRHTIF